MNTEPCKCGKQKHIHELTGSTRVFRECCDCHNHRFCTVTGEAMYTKDKQDHYHEVKFRTDFSDEHYVRPQAAWERMRAAQNSHQTVYIHGTTGSGKTSFVEDFLARRRYCYIHMADTAIEELAGIAQKEMEKAEKKENAQMIFVIDDLHVLESREEKTICGQLIEQMSVREDIWLILMSREPLPKWLMSAFVRSVFLIIGEQELHLDEEEQESGELILR